MNDGKIQDFDDNCSKSFNFVIKVDSKQDKEITKDPIKYFKLEQSYTENYTAIDENSCIKEATTMKTKDKMLKAILFLVRTKKHLERMNLFFSHSQHLIQTMLKSTLVVLTLQARVTVTLLNFQNPSKMD